MKTPFFPETELDELGPEVKSFICQTLMAFEPFTTPETTVTVTAKNPLELLSTTEEEEVDIILEDLPSKRKLRKMYRIEIALTEGGTTLKAEGLASDIYEAITMARDKLLKILVDIQNDVVSAQDRHMQIQHALAAGGSLH